MGTPRILICTPSKGAVAHPHFTRSLMRTVLVQGAEWSNAWEIVDVWDWQQDVIRMRSLMVHEALKTDCSHVLWIDDDQAWEPQVVAGLLRANRDMVGATYPRRTRIDFDRVAKDDGRPAEARAYEYVVRGRGEPLGSLDKDWCVEVPGLGFGMMLTSRACLEKMTKGADGVRRDFETIAAELVLEHEGDEAGLLAAIASELEIQRQTPPTLTFTDFTGPEPRTLPALFLEVIRDGELTGEDYSFCDRWRDLGGKVWLYLGPGSPVDHIGTHRYRGRVEAFGYRHPPAKGTR